MQVPVLQGTLSPGRVVGGLGENHVEALPLPPPLP